MTPKFVTFATEPFTGRQTTLPIAEFKERLARGEFPHLEPYGETMKKIVHQATDGKDFDTKEACEKHECELMFERIIEGADFAKIGSAIDGSNPELAAALEWVGNKCVVSRRASGALKRAPKKVAE